MNFWHCRRGDVFYVCKDAGTPEVGSEIRAGRPAIIVSNNLNNRYSNTVELVYLTTRNKPPLPTHVLIESIGTPSTALCEQICTVDKSRFVKYCGRLTADEMGKVDRALLISIDLNKS